MKKSIFAVIAVFFMLAFYSCKKEVTLTFSEDIIIDLGSTDEDVLKFVSASDGSTVNVSGIDYDLVGEQTATFKAGDVSETKVVKIKSDKLAGLYQISVFITEENNEYELTVGEGWLITLTKGSNYNQINIPDSIDKGFVMFIDQGKLVVTFNGKDSAYIPGYTGRFKFSTSKESEFTFSNIKYGTLAKGKYAITEFILNEFVSGYNHYYRIQLDRKD
ncbi:MAG: hypothetical protein PHC83_03485 [Bacteroidales bacterium]|nr:hypothetical protein [Bacteroidales bacterium]MDD4209938.1 hypothetical protein [Bacteroidales bacterium]